MTDSISLCSLTVADEAWIQQTAHILFKEFAKNYPEWLPTLQDALLEVMQSFQPERISRVAIVDGQVAGWIGGISQYDGNVYELHPIVVDSNYQRRGIGSRLIQDLEVIVQERGGITLWLGADDVDERTSIGGTDLYPNVLENLAKIVNTGAHQFEFYLKNGFSLSGVVPDANGFGKPDIYMAKRVTPWPLASQLVSPIPPTRQ